MKNVLTYLFLLFPFLTKGQESFNETKGPAIELQLMSHFVGTRISPLISYKIKRAELFTGFEWIQFKDHSNWLKGFKFGCRMFPYKNEKPLKIYYQSYLSYKWTYNETFNFQQRMAFFHIGAGLDYNLMKRLTLGCEFNLGYGPNKVLPNDIDLEFDLSPAFRIKYALK